MGGYSLVLRRFVFRMAERRARNEWLVMNRNRPWEGYCLLPAFLCAHVLKRDVWVRGRGGYVWKSESVPHVNRSAVPLITARSLWSPSISMQIMKLTKVRYSIWQAVTSILRRDWSKYQQLLITHPWKTQTTGTGIVIKESQFLNWFVMIMEKTNSPHSNVCWNVCKINNCCAISLNSFTDRVVGV